jgi:hypothetical protein
MTYIVKDIKKINLDLLLKLSQVFNFNKIETNCYEHILEFYDDKKLIAMINYCILPCMKGRYRLFIRNLYFLNKENLDGIIKSLCNYCKTVNLAIKTTFDNEKFDNDCKKALYDNNFKGDKVLYYIY